MAVASRWKNCCRHIISCLPSLFLNVPESLHDVVRSNQRGAYTALFSCAHESLKKLAKDKRFLGSSRIGYLAVLHTWGGNLQFHPHLHLLIPGGAISEKNEQWLPSRQDLFVHTKSLAVMFRAKFTGCHEKGPPYGSNTCFSLGA